MPPKDTLNINYLRFKESLPENLRLTPEKDYHMYDYWRLSGEPENFTEGKQRGMFTWDKSDKSYHAGSIAEDRNTGIYHFMKHKHHPTVKYELDWFNKGLKTLEGGKQVPVKGRDKKFWEDFISKYQLDTTGVDYRYVPIQKKGGNIHIKKKNRGKFTEYCGGKITEECIRKGKNSSNPTIRKRATFVANARKWKHQEGGILKTQSGISLYPKYGSWARAKLAYDSGYRDPEAISALFANYVPDQIISKSSSYTSRTNGVENDGFQSYYKTTGNNLGIEQKLSRINGNETGITTFLLPNGDTYTEDHINDTGQYSIDFAKRLEDKLPKPKSLFEEGGILKYQNPSGPILSENSTDYYQPVNWSFDANNSMLNSSSYMLWTPDNIDSKNSPQESQQVETQVSTLPEDEGGRVQYWMKKFEPFGLTTNQQLALVAAMKPECGLKPQGSVNNHELTKGGGTKGGWAHAGEGTVHFTHWDTKKKFIDLYNSDSRRQGPELSNIETDYADPNTRHIADLSDDDHALFTYLYYKPILDRTKKMNFDDLVAEFYLQKAGRNFATGATPYAKAVATGEHYQRAHAKQGHLNAAKINNFIRLLKYAKNMAKQYGIAIQ